MQLVHVTIPFLPVSHDVWRIFVITSDTVFVMPMFQAHVVCTLSHHCTNMRRFFLSPFLPPPPSPPLHCGDVPSNFTLPARKEGSISPLPLLYPSSVPPHLMTTPQNLSFLSSSSFKKEDAAGKDGFRRGNSSTRFRRSTTSYV